MQPSFSPCAAFIGRLLALLALFAAPSAAAQSLLQRNLGHVIDAVFDAEPFENAFWGAYVLDLNTGQVLYKRHEQKSFIPASNTKLYTTAAVLNQIGPAYQYRTALYTDGPVVDGELQGNLIVRGSGDPVIGGRFNDGDLTEVFRHWADSLRAHGITRISGDIIGDDDVFDDTPLGYGWSWDDEPFWYAAEVSGLSFNDNNVDFSIEAQGIDMPGKITWEPFNTSYIEVVNSTRTVPRQENLKEGYRRERGTNRFQLYSLVPQGRTDNESLTVSNPTLFFVHVFRESLLRSGIAVAGRPVDVDALPLKPSYDDGSLRRLALHTSPPLAKIVEVLNKRSQNLYAEQVLKTLAALRPVGDDPDLVPGSAEMGIASAMATFAHAGIDTSRLQLVDGSGLSRQNLVTPEMTAALLQYMWSHPDEAVREAFYASLPIGGIDGTLQYRYATGAARGKVRAKTGTVSNASTLSGYVPTAQGTPLAFVLMCMHYTVETKVVRAAQDEVVERLARLPY